MTISYLFPAPVVDLGPDTTICNGATLTLDAGAGYQYLWSDNSTNQSLDVTAAGVYSVLVTDANNCEAFDAITVSTVVCIRYNHSTTALARRSFGIYPNPSTGVVDINFSNASAADVQIDVVDVYGKALFHTSENLKAHDLRKYDLSNLSPGIYFVRVSYGSETQSIRLIKQ